MTSQKPELRSTQRPQRRTQFYRWLMQHKDHDTPLGDLARDAAADFEGMGAVQRGRCWDGTLPDLAQIIEDEGCAGAESTMQAARRRFRTYRRERRAAT